MLVSYILVYVDAVLFILPVYNEAVYIGCQGGAVVNRTVDKSSPSCVKLTKTLKQTLILKLLGLSDRDLNLESPCTTIISWAR